MTLREERDRRNIARAVAAARPDYYLEVYKGVELIVCKTCNAASANRNDIDQRYCGRCHRFHTHHPPQEEIKS